MPKLYYAHMLKEEIERFNEWWFAGSLRKNLAPPFKRYAFPRIMESLEERQILLVIGLKESAKQP